MVPFFILRRLELSVGQDGSPRLKGAEMKDLKRRCSALAALYSLFCSCLRELYGFYHQRARMLFLIALFFCLRFVLAISQKGFYRQVLL